MDPTYPSAESLNLPVKHREFTVPCRVIGTLNMLFCSVSIILLLMYTSLITYTCSYCEPEETTCRKTCEIDINYKINAWNALLFWTYVFGNTVVFIKLIVVNNGLRSLNPNTEGQALDSWMYYHKVLFVILSLSFLFAVVRRAVGSSLYLIYYGISSIALIVEIIMIGKYKDEYLISSGKPYDCTFLD